MSEPLSRREALTRLGAAIGTAGALGAGVAAAQDAPAPAERVGPEWSPPCGRLKQSVSKWCYDPMPLDDLCRNAAAMGLTSVELVDEPDWPVLKRHGLLCAMANGPGPIESGWNREANHDALVRESERILPRVRDAGFPNMIVFSGNRAGLADRDGIRACASGLKRIAPLAEQLGVTICLELLNSKVTHPDYQCDHTAWGLEVVHALGSPRVKLLYDIYHMQIMEGDVIRTVTDAIASIGHFHTGGVPGRHEIDDSQELNYRAICQAIVAAGYTGYLGHEFVPVRDPMTSLRAAIALCDV
jgi:hydroxypyruvate isomerase